MTTSRRLISSLVLAAFLGGAMVGAALLTGSSVRAQGCDPSYPEICLPSSPDIDCFQIGFPITVIHNPGIGAFDPHALDPDFNGIGCEFG